MFLTHTNKACRLVATYLINSQQAYKQGMYGSNYVWILTGPLVKPKLSSHGPEDWADYSGCTVEQVTEASNGYLSLNYDKLDAQNGVTVNDKVSFSVVNLVCHVKACIRDVRPGLTQICLYNHRRLLEA